MYTGENSPVLLHKLRDSAKISTNPAAYRVLDVKVENLYINKLNVEVNIDNTFREGVQAMAKTINIKEKYFRSVMETTCKIGLENITVRSMAKTLGVSEAALYRHFIGKDQLLSETYFYAESLFWDRFATEIYSHGFSDTLFSEILEQVWIGIFNYLRADDVLAVFLLRYRASAEYTDQIRKDSMLTGSEMEPVMRIFRSQIGEPSPSGISAFDAALDGCVCHVCRGLRLGAKVDPKLDRKISKALSEVFMAHYTA